MSSPSLHSQYSSPHINVSGMSFQSLSNIYNGPAVPYRGREAAERDDFATGRTRSGQRMQLLTAMEERKARGDGAKTEEKLLNALQPCQAQHNESILAIWGLHGSLTGQSSADINTCNSCWTEHCLSSTIAQPTIGSMPLISILRTCLTHR